MKREEILFITTKELEKERIELIKYMNKKAEEIKINKKLIKMIDFALITYNCNITIKYKIK